MIKPELLTIHLIAAARPNFMKVAPLFHALSAEDWCRPLIIHTGQHYDANMSDDFFRDFNLPEPAYHLGIGSGSHAEQTGNVMIAYEKICLKSRPDWLVVVGDVNPTAACSMTAAKLGIPIVHLEAGLRSGDRGMPEEINRLVTDVLADVLWTPSPDADKNLAREGISQEKITRIGNIMMDSFELLKPQIEADKTLEKYGYKKHSYGVVTFHRPSNVDHMKVLATIIDQLCHVSEMIQLIFPIHPRTRQRLNEFGLMERLAAAPNIRLLEPVSYIPFMALVKSAKLILTDSGGVQEETTYLDIPCLTVRPNTERPITVTEGTNKLVKPEAVVTEAQKALSGDWQRGKKPDLWDGQAAKRAARDLKRRSLAAQ